MGSQLRATIVISDVTFGFIVHDLWNEFLALVEQGMLWKVWWLQVRVGFL